MAFAAERMAGAPTPPAPAEVDQATHQRVEQTLVGLPLRFEENNGRFDSEVKYLARGKGYTLFVTPTETVLTVRQSGKDDNAAAKLKGQALSSAKATASSLKGRVVRTQLEGANCTTVLHGEGELSAPTNYFVGNDPTKWHTATNYERVRCESVYPGVDLLYYGNQHELEYDFELAPGADPKQIAFRYSGVQGLHVESDGTLVLRLKGGQLRQHPPVAYQVIDGERREVRSRYLVKGKRRVGFVLGDYDASQKLIIDPVLSYSTYLGGNGTDLSNAVAVDSQGNAYVTGRTNSTDFPTRNQYQINQLDYDAFVTKLNPNTSGAASLLYSTYLGGSSADFGNSIAVDSSGNAYVAGTTQSTNFPTRNQYQTNQAGGDAFVTKLNTNVGGSASLVYSTYLGGNDDDSGTGIAADRVGNVYVTGATKSTNFPIRNQYQMNQGGQDIYVTKLKTNAGGSASLLYSTYLGGGTDDYSGGIAVDSSGNAYVTGGTTSTNFPTRNAYQVYGPGQGVNNAIVTKLNPNVSGAASLLYSTYLSGDGVDLGTGIAVDSRGNVYVTGYTGSTNFPLRNQYQTDQPSLDAFVTKLDTEASGPASLLYSTYLGGGDVDFGYGIAVDGAGNVSVTGQTYSTNFPTLHPYQINSDCDGGQQSFDVFVTVLKTNGSGTGSLLYSTYLGSDMTDVGYGIAVDRARNAYVTGSTDSVTFPTVNQYQTDRIGGDAFVSKFRLALYVPAPLRADFNGDGSSDILWQNNSTGARTIWLMNGTAFSSSVSLGIVVTSWKIVGSSDFNGDGQSDILWQNNLSGARTIWLMNGTTFSSNVPLGSVSTSWDIVGAADFNSDGKPDILWQNSVTGARVIWLMNGTVFSSSVSLGTVATSWNIVGSGDFNGDSQTDILWQNNLSGARVIWLMNGTVFNSSVSLGTVATSWDIGGAGDFNGDDKPDILWQNSVTGARTIWLMNGTVFSSSVSLGTVATQWEIENY